jgi:hypothetical protein
MADKTLSVKVLQVVKTTAQWEAISKPLDNGLLGIETTATGKVHAKVGNGTDQWTALPYVTDPTVDAKITAAIEALGPISKVKGTVATMDDLENVEDPQQGDVYFVGTNDPENPTEDAYQEYIYVVETVTVDDPEHPGETIEQEQGRWEFIGSANEAYELPIASSETLGGVKIANTGILSINSETGILSASVPVMTGATPLVPGVEPDPEDPEDQGTPEIPASAGTAGLVPAPQIGDENKVLSGAGTWVNMPDTTQLEERVQTIEEEYVKEEDFLTLLCTFEDDEEPGG